MTRPPGNTAKKRGKRADLEAWLEQSKPVEIGEAELADLEHALAPVSRSYLKKLLRETGVKLAPIVAGVRQSNSTELEESLIALLDEYERGDAHRRMEVRELVITAKDHARFAMKRGHPEKEEMILWMLTWLENPPVFREWVRLRQRART